MPGAIYVPSQIGDIVGLQSALDGKAGRTAFYPRGAHLFDRGLVTTRCHHYTDNTAGTGALSNGTDLGGTFRIRHVVVRSATEISLAFGNFYNQDASPGNNITVRAAIEYPSGTYWPVFFGGKRDVVIEPFGVVVSDPVGIPLNTGDYVYTRNYVTVASSGQKWPQNYATIVANGEGNNRSTTPTDLTTSGTITAVYEWGFGPLAILGTMNPANQAALALIGDSICAGRGDDPAYDGYLARGCGTSLPFYKMGLSGETAQQFVQNKAWRRSVGLPACSHAIVEYGHNDIFGGRTLAQIQSDLTTIWNQMVTRGLKVYQSTITPRTTSTDSWATTTNQTPAANFGASSIRTQLNDWIRTTPSPLTGYLEAADLAESARNSGLWRPGYTSDGIHPNSTGAPALSACLVPSAFTI